jgi:hypothetical protein
MHLIVLNASSANGSHDSAEQSRKEPTMSKGKQKMVTAVFRDHYEAERAFDYLSAKGYANNEINVLMSDRTRASFVSPKDRSKNEAGSMATEGMGVGGAIGTVVGAALAAVAAIGTTLAIPLTGGASLVVAGPIAAALAGAGAGAVTGGAIGALVGWGITEQNARAYEDALREGGVVIGVIPRNADHTNDIETMFKELNGENVCYC